MKCTIALTLEADLVRRVRELAARQGTSVGRLVAAKLEDLVREERGFERSKRRALERLAVGWELRVQRSSSRDDLHDR